MRRTFSQRNKTTESRWSSRNGTIARTTSKNGTRQSDSRWKKVIRPSRLSQNIRFPLSFWFLSVIVLFCTDVQILQCLASQAIQLSQFDCQNVLQRCIFSCHCIFCDAHRKITRPRRGFCSCKMSILIFAMVHFLYCQKKYVLQCKNCNALAVQATSWSCIFALELLHDVAAHLQRM